MKVVCDNCRAVYKVPDDKLTKPVNKATCRNCGHRMLIPRPQEGADPDEQTVVTSMPPTPATVIREHRPRSRELPLATPLGLSRKDSPAPPRSAPAMGSPAAAAPPPRPVAVPVAPPPALASETALRPPHSPGPVDARAKVPAPLHQGARAPAPSPLAVAVVEPITTPGARAPRPRAAPEAPRTPPPVPRSYDPGADLNQAGVGAGLALVGSMLLAFLFVWDHAALLWIGLALSLGGGVLTLGILQTGDRGRRPARKAFAATLGLLFAIAVPSALVGVKWFVAEAREAYALNFDAPSGTASDPAEPAEAAIAVITAPATPPDPLPTEVADPIVAEPEPVAVAPPPPTPAPRPAPAPRPKPPPKPSSVASKPAPVSVPAGTGVATVAPAVAPPPAPALPATVPIEAVHVMLSSNVEVKRCFVPLLQAGQLPPRVDLKFDIQASGTASGGRVVQSEYKGSELEGCLARTVAAIKFPPTSGNGTSITYPFILQ